MGLTYWTPNINIFRDSRWGRGQETYGEDPFLTAKLGAAFVRGLQGSDPKYLQAAACAKHFAVHNTCMTVAIDLGEWNDIHPDNKKDVGERLALAAMKVAYGEELVYSGPLFKSATIKGNKISISFTNIGSGLITNDGEELKAFAIAGADKKFVWAKATIEGDQVIVWSNEIDNPLYIRYAWADNPDVNFYNKEALPASPFRTDQ